VFHEEDMGDDAGGHGRAAAGRGHGHRWAVTVWWPKELGRASIEEGGVGGWAG
jgi:hypothetical protein